MKKKLPLFESFTDEELDELEKLYRSPAWKALMKAANNHNASLANSAYQYRDSRSFGCYERIDGIEEFFATVSQTFDAPEKKPVPESKPKTLDSLIP